MYNPDTEILFPLRILPQLRGLRGEEWAQLVDHVCSPEATRLDKAAMVLMMVRMGGCVSCNADSFRAMRGCTLCARQTIRRIKNPDAELVEQHQQYKKEVELFLQKQANPPAESTTAA